MRGWWGGGGGGGEWGVLSSGQCMDAGGDFVCVLVVVNFD